MLKDIITEGTKYTMNTYKRWDIAFTSGSGCYLKGVDEKDYLDMISGLGACNLGHSHPVVVKAIQEQAAKYIHVSNGYWIKEQVDLAKLLVENSFADKAFFCNSGAEANEGAIKLARRYSYNKYGESRNEIISMTSAFHGRTLATLSITYNKNYSKGYGPMPEGFKTVEFNNIHALKDAITEKTCAIILEPIQGEGGLTPADKSFIKEMREIADEKDILLIFDEIQCGIGRTGKLFAYEHYDVEPDIMTLAKALAGGFPIGAILANEKLSSVFNPGDHGTTFGGNPLACSAGFATMNYIINEKLWEKAEEKGKYFKSKLEDLSKKYSWIKGTKGKGLMIGLELDIKGGEIVEKALEQNILINCTADKILRFLPALIIEKTHIDKTIEVLDSIFQKINVE